MSFVRGWRPGETFSRTRQSIRMNEQLSQRRMREALRHRGEIEAGQRFTLRALRLRFGSKATDGLSAVVNTIENVGFLTPLHLLAVRCSSLDELREKLWSLQDPNLLPRTPVPYSR